MDASLVSCDAIWICRMLIGLFCLEMGSIVIQCNNQSYTKISKILMFHDMSKHIETRYHFIRDRV